MMKYKIIFKHFIFKQVLYYHTKYCYEKYYKNLTIIHPFAFIDEKRRLINYNINKIYNNIY